MFFRKLPPTNNRIALSFRSFILVLLLFLSAGKISAQNARQYLKAGDMLLESGMPDAALEEYYKAAALDSNDGKLQAAIGQAHLANADSLKAAESFYKAAVLNFDPIVNYSKASELFLLLKDFARAKACTDRGLAIKPRDEDLLLLKTRIFLELGDFKQAFSAAEAALAINESARNLYYYGLAAYHAGDTIAAEKALEKAIIRNSRYEDAYLALAKIQYATGHFQYTIDNCSVVLTSLNVVNIAALALRSKAYLQKNDTTRALADLNKALIIGGDNFSLYMFRAGIHASRLDTTEAIADYSQALLQVDTALDALTKRAELYALLGEKENALKDYRLILQLVGSDEAHAKLAENVQQKIFDLGREENKPVIFLLAPKLNEQAEITVEEGQQQLVVSGTISDMSGVKMLRLNNLNLSFLPAGVNEYRFDTLLTLEKIDFISFTIADVYDNLSTETFPIIKTEKEKPRFELQSPAIDEDLQILLHADDNSLYFEGSVLDKSPIVSIKIDGSNANFTQGKYNPRFTAIVDVRNRSSITLSATDLYGNESLSNYTLQRPSKLNLAESPMGKTWVVVVDNNNYAYQSNVYPESKELKNLLEIFSHYEFAGVIYKTNMSLREMEWFFSIELRDLARNNKVKSLLIWYSGLADVQEEKAFWLPVDSRKNEPSGFYKINALQASLASYSTLNHLLVVSSAGYPNVSDGMAPHSLEACYNTELLSKKSAQMLGPAFLEVNQQNPLFLSAFIHALQANPAACIPVDALYERISLGMEQEGMERSVLFPLKDLGHENGTFFFVRKIIQN